MSPEEVEKQAAALLDQLRPYLHSEGCDAIVDHTEVEKVYLHMSTLPAGCASQRVLLQHALYYRMRKEIPSVKEVVFV